MKELFEVDMKGNNGGTIDSIVSFSKNVELLPCDFTDQPDEEITYEIKLKYKSGKTETLRFRRKFELFKENGLGGNCEYLRETK